jgi:hypothetical protein
MHINPFIKYLLINSCQKSISIRFRIIFAYTLTIAYISSFSVSCSPIASKTVIKIQIAF